MLGENSSWSRHSIDGKDEERQIWRLTLQILSLFFLFSRPVITMLTCWNDVFMYGDMSIGHLDRFIPVLLF